MSARRALWLDLLNAALDQPQPTQRLKNALLALFRRDPIALDTPDEKQTAQAPKHRSRASERLFDGLLAIQMEHDDDA